MDRAFGWWAGVVFVALVGVATVSIGAQTGVAPMSAERSYALQSELQAIDQNRVGFVDDMLRDWANYVDPAMYNFERELKPIAMKAPVWQLYGASLVGDFPTMLRVLTGVEGAGTYINALTAPQTKTAYTPALLPSGPIANDLGASTSSLVFTPIAPCRVADTRLSPAGILPAGSARSFDLTTDSFTKNQGGATSCTGLPSYSYYGWAVNIAVTGYSGSGWLVAWPYGGVETTTAVSTYGPAVYALSSGVTLTGCLGCVNDVNIRAYNAATHVIIDVVGYYQDAYAAGATVTRVVGDVEAVGANNSLYIDGGACPAGTVLIGGEVDHGENDLAVAKTMQYSSTIWRFWMKNNTAYAVTATGWSRCLDSPVRVF
jgi:hypothetical protein